MRQMNSLKDRAIAVILAVTLIVGLLPFNVVSATGSTVFGMVEGITAGAEVADANGSAPVVYYDTAELSWAPADPSVGRMSAGWWVGIKITAPADMTKLEDFVVDSSTYVKYQTGVGEGWSADKSFWNAQDSDKSAEDTPRYLTMWGKLDESILKNANLNGKSVTYRWQFDWDMDGTFEQLVTLSIDPSNIVLTKNSATVYPMESVGYGTLEMLTGGAQITGNGTANVTVEHNTETEIRWYPADPSIGRYQEGWWAGMKITAPIGISVEQLKSVHYMSGTNLREFWAAKDSADDAAEHFMTMWIPLNGLLSGLIAPYTYKFDWNNDGIFEQTVTLSVDAEKVTLTKDGVQVYPTLGAVSAYTGGTVSGSKTSEVTVTVEETTLSWSAADLSIGRYMDAWWAGIRVEAPAGITEEQLKNAKYQRKDSDTWSSDKSFWNNKDSQVGAATHYIGMWIPLTPAILATAEANHENITREYRFDWDNNGTYEQHIVFTIVPSDDIVLTKVSQSGFRFETETPADQWVGSTYQNAAIGGQSGEAIVYEIVEGPATISTDGTVTFTGLGKVTVKATRPGNDTYKEITATYVVTAVRNAWEPFAFAVSNPTITYSEGLVYPNANYQNALTGSDGAVTYALVVDGELVTETNVAKINPTTGAVTVLTAGTVTIRASRAADDRYNEASAEYTLNIEKADQTEFGFGETEKVTVTYNDNGNRYTLAATGGQSGSDVVYSVISGDAASVDNQGVVTIIKAGTVTIQATKPADVRYNAISDTYEMTIKPDTQEFVFEYGDTIDIFYGTSSYTNQVVFSGEYSKSSSLTYTLSENEIGATIDSATGSITFVDSQAKVGTLTITATKAADDCYSEYSHSYTVIVSYENTPDLPYTLHGEKIISDGDWFTGDVTIKAPKGYQISYSNALEGNTWDDSVLWKVDGCEKSWGTDSAPVVYLKNTKTGGFTDAIPVPDLKRDTVPPTELSISYDVDVWATIDEKLFGFHPSTVKVTIDADDSMSGISKMEYSLDGGVHYTEIAAEDGKYELFAPAQYRGQLWMRATDVAGNAAVYKHLDNDTDKVLVVDNTVPGLNVGYTGGMDDAATSGIRYVKSDKVTVVFDFTDENFDLRAADPVVKVNNSEKTDWIFDATSGKLTIDIADEGDYEIKAEFTDRLNRKVEYESEIRVDRTKPTIESTIADGQYYTKNKTFTLSIVEHNFDAGKVSLVVDAVDGRYNSVLNADEIQKFADDAKNPPNWKHTEGTDLYTLVLPIYKDGHYTITVNCDDVLGWSADTYTRTFTVDNIAPTANITYNAPVQTVNGISYYAGNINATIVINEANFSARDVVVVVTKNGAALPVNVTWHDNSVDAHTGTFTLTDDGNYIVSVRYTDKSGNQMKSYTSNELTLDNTKPNVKVSNIKANSANKDEKYSFVITVNDTNLDASSIKPVLKAVVQKEEGVYIIADIDLGQATTVADGQTYTYTVEDLPDDGLYTLTCEVMDMSANGMSQIVLDDGKAYDQIQFSINRSGSAFGYGNQFTEDLVSQYYIYSVDEDVVIVEVNVDPIEDYKISLNGKELVEGIDYTTVQTSKDDEWSMRTYTIKKALFEAEGEYSVIVSSTDKAETTVFSDVKNLSLAFVVDQTKPILTITGLETGGRYQTDVQTVTLIPTDEGGRLNNLSVVVLDSNGNPLKDDNGIDISVRFEMSGEELLRYLEENDGKVIFTIPEGLNNQVKIICNDCAVNADNLTNEYNKLFERVTVSQNRFVIFYANTPLFIGTIVGALAASFLIIFFIKHKKDKKNKAKAKV